MGKGYFGSYGGQFVPEEVKGELRKLEAAYEALKEEPTFLEDLAAWQRDYIGRPSPLYPADRMTKDLGGARIYLKREDLNHTGSHKINNVIGQALLAKRMGKSRLIAETGAGQHGVATATAATLMGLDCDIYMGEEDCRRQALNVRRMKMLGATVHPVMTGSRVLKDAVDAALEAWAREASDSYYLLGSVVGPHPYPLMVRDFQRVIGREAKAQILDREGRLPDAVVACVGGGSNAMGIFYDFIEDKEVALIGCEAGGKGLSTGLHASAFGGGRPGDHQGMRSYFCQDEEDRLLPVYSISAGLDYPGVGPEHAWLHDEGRASYVSITDQEALEAFHYLARTEGIIPALESAHAVAQAMKMAPDMRKDQLLLVNLSGRGDKDLEALAP